MPKSFLQQLAVVFLRFSHFLNEFTADNLYTIQGKEG